MRPWASGPPCRMEMGYPVRASARTRRRRDWYRESAYKLTRELPAPRLGASEPVEQSRDADAPASAGTTLQGEVSRWNGCTTGVRGQSTGGFSEQRLGACRRRSGYLQSERMTSRYPCPNFSSGSRWLPSAHSLHDFTKTMLCSRECHEHGRAPAVRGCETVLAWRHAAPGRSFHRFNHFTGRRLDTQAGAPGAHRS